MAYVSACRHRPVSNGWCHSWRPDGLSERPTAWCGFCRRQVGIDAEWAEKYATAHPTDSGERLVRAVADADRAGVGECALWCVS